MCCIVPNITLSLFHQSKNEKVSNYIIFLPNEKGDSLFNLYIGPAKCLLFQERFYIIHGSASILPCHTTAHYQQAEQGGNSY